MIPMQILKLSEEQSIETSEISNDSANSDISLDATGNSTGNASNNSSNNSSIDSSKVPYKFSSTKNISSTYGKKAKFSVKVLNNEGKAINHTLVTFKVSGKTYNRYTNASGIAYIYLNLNAGKYAIKYNASGISGKNTYTVKNYYKITNYKWKSGANVLKNKRIKANVPNSTLVRKKIIKLGKIRNSCNQIQGWKRKSRLHYCRMSW